MPLTPDVHIVERTLTTSCCLNTLSLSATQGIHYLEGGDGMDIEIIDIELEDDLLMQSKTYCPN